MDINQITAELDALFAQERIGEIPQFLESHIAQAVNAGAHDVALTLYNEIIGFYRETGQYALSIENCHKAIALMDGMGIKDTIPYATTLLNAANAHRAAGMLQESLEFYNRVRPIYVALLKEDDMYFASFYNNLSLLYQEMGDFASAKEQLENALYIVKHRDDKKFEVAVTQANLANTCIELGLDDEAKARAEEAIRIFEELGVDDAHYSAALSALGSLYYMDKDYPNALEAMEKGRECVAKYLGTDNIQYKRLSDNIAIIKGRIEECSEVLGILDDDFMESYEEELKEEEPYEEMSYEEGSYEEEPYEEESYEEEQYEEGQYEEGSYEEESYEEGSYEEGSYEEGSYEEEPYEEEPSEEESYEEGSYEEEPYEEEPGVEAGLAGEGLAEEQVAEEPREEEPEDEEPEEPEFKGLELCRSYYENYGKPMIAEKFGAYEHVIAAGLVGKGSDCFGFDDMQSRDHDFGPRFFLWVTKQVYDEIGKELQEEYEKLPDEHMGVKRTQTSHGRDRSGVMIIEEFYKNVLGCDLIGAIVQCGGMGQTGKESLATIKNWLAVHDYALASAVNGEVFRDDEGIFTRYRERLMEYYPKAVWYRKIAQTCALFSQNGQYNLPRMRGRRQGVAAELAKAECARQAMKLYYLFNKKYAPHDKWLFKGMAMNLEMMAFDEDMKVWGVPELVKKICTTPADRAHERELSTAIELLAVIFANELERKNMVGLSDLYLDASTKELTAKSDALLTAIVADTPVVTALSLSIAKAEFEAFDKVKNEGGRASCQNNWPTFKVMRMSQYMTWTEDMLLQYLYEFKTNYENGRNMVEEKYARMMESTAPLEYAAFADRLPPVSDDKKAVMEQIIGLQVNWMEEFSRAYPNLADNARAIHTSQDLPYDTSYETYLRGELGTYSDRMLEMYGRHIVECARSGRNMAREIMENTVHFYGYNDLESANEKGID